MRQRKVGLEQPVMLAKSVVAYLPGKAHRSVEGIPDQPIESTFDLRFSVVRRNAFSSGRQGSCLQ